MSSLIVNSAHAQSNYTSLAFSRDGSRIFTGGEEGYVRIWKTELGSMQEPDVATEGEDGITSITTSNDCWLSGSLDSCVRSYDAQGSTMEGLVTRAIAVPIRCIAIDPKGERVAVTSDELEVRLVDLRDVTKIQKLEGHHRGVRKVTWHPSGTILTTSGSDGNIIAWAASPNEEPKQIEIIAGIIPTVDVESPEFAHDCSAVWHPTGKYFIVATQTHELIAISREGWKKTFSFSDDAATGVITAVALSPNGSYVAAATSSGITIWSTATRKALFRHIPGSSFITVSHLAFSPTQNLLAWTDIEGTLTRWPAPIPSAYPDPVNFSSVTSNIGVPAKKRSNPLDFDEDETTNKSKREEKDQGDDYDMDVDDWMIDDLGVLNPEKERDKGEGSYTKEMVSVTKAQPAFQPGSTPMINKKGYMAFNMIGVIEVTDQNTHNVINVEFHDRTTHIGSHFQDTKKCHMASLGQRGALYACTPEAGHPAQIMYKPYSNWASSGEWYYSLPEGEAVIALAAGGEPPTSSLRNKSADGDVEGNGNVVIATNQGYLRFFSGSGIQRYIWTMAADIVSMVAGCEWVFVVHRDGGTSLDGCQNLSYTLIAWNAFAIVQKGILPLPRGSTLKWIGISEEGAPAMYDSNGMLSILDKFRRPHQARWIPFLDTNTLARRHGKDESYWPVGVSGTQFMCIILKGQEQYPGFPRPLVQDLDIQMPLINIDTTQGEIEERFLREGIHVGFLRDALGSQFTDASIFKREVSLDKELIQLIQLACKADNLQRALDAAALLLHVSSFDMAIKIAEFYHLSGLQEKLKGLKTERESRNRLNEECDDGLSWRKEFAPIPAPQIRTQGSSSRPHFNTFASNTSIRKSLAPAVPLGGNRSNKDSPSWDASRTVAATVVAMQTGFPDSSLCDASFNEDDSFSSIAIPDGKRKRDSPDVQDIESESAEESAQKKQALVPANQSDFGSAKYAKLPSNPFVRKGQEMKSNPFARATVKENIKKSNSFFDKVDEANENATQDKSKTKAKDKSGTRQTTLFGFAKPKNTKGDSSSESAQPPQVQGQAEEKVKQTILNDSTLLPPASQGEDENEEMIEWPLSPPRIPGNSQTSEVAEIR